MPFNLSTGEILVLLLVAVVIFGGKLPEVARKAGSALSQFRRGMSDELRKIENEARVDEPAGPDEPEPPAGGG